MHSRFETMLKRVIDPYLEKDLISTAHAKNMAAGPFMQLRAQLIASMYARTRSIVITFFASGLLSVAFVSTRVQVRWLLIWFILLLVVLAARVILLRRYQRAAPAAEEASRWARYFVVMSVIVGVFWASSGYVLLALFPVDPVVSIFVFTLSIGFVAGAASGLASHLPAFFAFSIPLMLPLAIVFLFRGGDLHLTLLGMLVIFFAFQVAYARNGYRASVDSIIMRFDNLHLIAEAEAANVAKSKFLAAASHDLRQPLHALILFVSALNERIGADQMRKIVANINVSARALEQLFAALLDISRLDAGVIQPRLRTFRLQELFDLLRNDYAAETQSKGLTFSCPPTDFIVHTDPQLLERILRNYLSNAIRYTARGEIALRCVMQDKTIRIDVADSGKGIPHDKHEEIFREFHQLENPERDRTKGLGLGLAIVDRLAKLLEHPIGLTSGVATGSVFHVVVPEGDVGNVGPLHSPEVESGVDLSGMLVLVIDDEISIREGMNTLLGQWGCKLILAGSEEEAVELLHQQGVVPDVVIADYRLREEKTGIQAIRRVHVECGIDMPGLIIAGDTAPERLREVAASGFPLFHKPVPPSQLRAFLQSVLLGPW